MGLDKNGFGHYEDDTCGVVYIRFDMALYLNLSKKNSFRHVSSKILRFFGTNILQNTFEHATTKVTYSLCRSAALSLRLFLFCHL